MPSKATARRDETARRTSRWPWIVLGFLVGAGAATLAGTLWTAGRRITTAPAREKATPRPPPGAVMWSGNLHRVRIELSPPRDFIRPESCLTLIEPWVLAGADRDDVASLLREHLIPLDIQRSILATTQCNPGQGCVVEPTADTLFALEPMTRRALYRVLGNLPGNPTKRTPFRFREWEWSRFTGDDGLSPAAREALQKLIVNEDGWLLFWDSGALCQRLDDQDKVRFVRTVTRSETYLVKLVLRSDTDVEPIIRYWTGRRRQKSLQTLLESARPKGTNDVRIDLVHLISPFLRALAYTYPTPGDPKYDCHWTTLNFFEEQPTDRYLDPRAVVEAFSTRFEPIKPESARYGDVVAIVTEKGEAIHTAIYLAEDLVFSKNGNSLYSPWIVTTMDFLMRLYQETPGTHPEFLRRREE